MKRLPIVAALTLLFAIAAQAADTQPNTAIVPVPRNEALTKRHEGFVEIAKKGNVDLLFLGDSITDGWRGGGKDVWQENFEPLKAANFGIGGDRTQHVLWRLQNGELEGIKPKLAVLMIGTNNLGSNTDEEIVEGIKAIIAEVHKQTPDTKILLLGIFPRTDHPYLPRIKHINSIIAQMDDGGKTIKYLDIGDKFMQPDGTISRSIMRDLLHPTAKGYVIWAKAINPTVHEMMK
jgi:lysophospholipase L1-like esterase